MALKLLSGNQAVAEAACLARAQVIPAYPITPQTTIVETLAERVGAGKLDADYITVESEHSAMAVAIGASLTGVRTFTATSSQGLAYMHEMLHWASGQRVPIVMANVNRALGPPWNIWTDQSDSMSQRDTGWVQLYAETNQEALDATLIAFRIAESSDVMLPVMVMQDAFLLSHTYMPVDVPSQETIDAFLPSYRPSVRVEPGQTQLFGSFSPPDFAYMELRRDLARAMDAARTRLLAAEREYERLTGRHALGLVEEYRTEGAEAAIVASGSLAATARDAVDTLRKQGLPVGLVRLRSFRPFPAEELREIGRRIPVLGVVDRAHSYGSGGPVATEVRAALLPLQSPPRVGSFIAGLGGRDVRPDELMSLLERLLKADAPAEEWIGVKPEVL
ncbi:MAG: transketolase C-terminal domain-containing protein [Candidatus Thermoplasmatota archaeon]